MIAVVSLKAPQLQLWIEAARERVYCALLHCWYWLLVSNRSWLYVSSFVSRFGGKHLLNEYICNKEKPNAVVYMVDRILALY